MYRVLRLRALHKVKKSISIALIHQSLAFRVAEAPDCIFVEAHLIAPNTRTYMLPKQKPTDISRYVPVLHEKVIEHDADLTD